MKTSDIPEHWKMEREKPLTQEQWQAVRWLFSDSALPNAA